MVSPGKARAPGPSVVPCRARKITDGILGIRPGALSVRRDALSRRWPRATCVSGSHAAGPAASPTTRAAVAGCAADPEDAGPSLQCRGGSGRRHRVLLGKQQPRPSSRHGTGCAPTPGSLPRHGRSGALHVAAVGGAHPRRAGRVQATRNRTAPAQELGGRGPRRRRDSLQQQNLAFHGLRSCYPRLRGAPPGQTGPLASPSNPNYTELQAFADIDALAELHGHIRAENPRMTVHFKIPSKVGHDDLTGHIILIGGVVWNEITDRLSEEARLPVRQFRHPGLPSGEIFIAEVDGEEQEFWPKWKNSDTKALAEDVGLLARVPNPLNSSRTLTICNGIHSRGVYGAVRSLTDTHLRDANERYISTKFGNSASFAILMSVKVINNETVTPDFSGKGVVLYRWSQDVDS